MRSIVKYINEKLHIGQFKKEQELSDIEIEDLKDKLKGVNINDLSRDLNMSPAVQEKHRQKMEGYFNKGSKPSRLVATIKDKQKLIARWREAIYLEWDSAVHEFTEEIIKRNYYTKEQLQKYILNNILSNNPKMKKYL